MSKLIFLDIDGVLRTRKSDLDWSRELGVPIFKGTERLFSKEAVENLNDVIYLTKAKIVVTSNWRLKLSLDEFKVKFKEAGIIGEVIGVTTTDYCEDERPLPFGHRGLEIRRWLNNYECHNYVIIDDQISDIVEIFGNERVHKVNPLDGFEDVNAVLDILL